MSALGEPPEVLDIKSRGTWVERVPVWVMRLATIGALSDDTEKERLRKASLILTASMVTALAVVWVTTY